MKNLLPYLLLFAIAITSTETAQAEFYERDRQLMISHRMANRDTPENTLESLEESALLGADIVEIDIRRTLDGELVLLHDGPIDRVSTGSGDVERMLAAEFALHDAGSWMNPRFAGLRHPRLDEALHLARRLGLKLVLDLKSTGITRQVYDMVRAEGMIDRVRFGGKAAGIREIDPALNTQETASWQPGMSAKEVAELQSEGLIVIATFSANRHELDLPLMRAAVAAGVNAINTDHPRLAADALGRPIEAKAFALRQAAERGSGIERAKSLLELARYRDFDLTAYFAEMIFDGDPAVSRAAAVALVQRARPNTVGTLIESTKVAPFEHVSGNQAWVIGMLPSQVDEAARRFLLAKLNDSSFKTIQEALLALGRIPGSFPTDKIVNLVDHESGLVSGAAVLALSRHDPASADRLIPALARRLREEIEKTWRQYAAPAEANTPLGKSRTTFERPTDPRIPRREAIMARAVDLYGGYHKTLAAAASSQSELATRWLHEELERYADDFSNFASYIAAFQLWDRADPDRLAQNLAAHHPFIRDRAQWTLVKSRSESTPALLRVLASPDRDARLRAIQSLAWIGDPQAVPQLEKLRQQADQDAEHYTWAINKITQINRITEIRRSR